MRKFVRDPKVNYSTRLNFYKIFDERPKAEYKPLSEPTIKEFYVNKNGITLAGKNYSDDDKE